MVSNSRTRSGIAPDRKTGGESIQMPTSRSHAMKSHPSSLPQARAFTLIELLTVTAIIAVLSAAIFPGVKASMRNAQMNAAMQNARQVAMALRNYAGDFEGMFPGVIDSETEGEFSNSNEVFRTLFIDYIDSERVFAVAGSAWGPQADGRIAVGSYDRGIAVGRAQGPWLRLGRANGLPSDTVFNLFEHAGALLVSYHDGVYRLPPESFAAHDDASRERAFEMLLLDEGERPGRSRIRCCNGAGNDKGILLADSVLLPSLAGIVELPLDTRPADAPQAEVLEVVFAGTARVPRPVLTLPVGVRDLEVGFRAVDFRNAGRLRFRYRLDGFDADWQDVAGRSRAAFSRLPPGRYRFQVQARLSQQPWGEAAGFELVVPQRFVEGWLFRLLLLLAAVVLVVALFRWRLHRLHLQRLALAETVAARTRDLALANARLETLNRDLAEASLVDPLTQLRNRRFVLERMPGLLAQVRRQRQDSGRDLVLGLMLVDADSFKRINDRYGHETGDRVLCRIAKALHDAVRAGDEAVRWGGEEFLVVLPGVARGELMTIADRIRTGIEASSGGPGQPSRVTASVGAAGWPLTSDGGERHDWQVALSLADFELLAGLDADIVLLGTGKRLRFPRPELLQPLVRVQRGLEVMDLAAACRTYNVLVGEGRRVAAGLLIA